MNNKFFNYFVKLYILDVIIRFNHIIIYVNITSSEFVMFVLLY